MTMLRSLKVLDLGIIEQPANASGICYLGEIDSFLDAALI
jgi:hypothetical protein